MVKGCFQKRWGPDRTIECIQIYNYEEVYAYEKAFIIFIWTTKPLKKAELNQMRRISTSVGIFPGICFQPPGIVLHD